MRHETPKPLVSSSEIRRLKPPTNPREAVESRRNPCYGFAVNVDLFEHKGLISFLTETRDEILKIIDPERDSKPRPVKSPLYIKQKYFHAAVFGMQPLMEQAKFQEVYAADGAILSSSKDEICEGLQQHLQDQKPYLDPVRCEIMPDGTVLARFAYKTSDVDDEAPLLALTSKLDPERKFTSWDSSNTLRYKTVAVAICVIDRERMVDKIDAVKALLEESSKTLLDIGRVDVNKFEFLDSYDKRTLSQKHTHTYAKISADAVELSVAPDLGGAGASR